MEYPKRGEIYDVNFGPLGGAEIAKTRPALVIQNNTANRFAATTIVAAIRGNLEAAKLPVGVLIEPKHTGLDKTSVVDLGHIQTIDKRRLLQFRGKIPEVLQEKVDRAVEVSLALKLYRL